MLSMDGTEAGDFTTLIEVKSLSMVEGVPLCEIRIPSIS